eukprot:1156347-Pelagomonas_calceolata.AAC.13
MPSGVCTERCCMFWNWEGGAHAWQHPTARHPLLFPLAVRAVPRHEDGPILAATRLQPGLH